MKKNTVVVILLAVLLMAFNSPAAETEKIIGENDLTLVNSNASNIPTVYRSLVQAFGVLSMGCTATHIGQGYVLTAGHCFDLPEVLTRNKDCSDTTIQWGGRVGSRPYLTSRCEQIISGQLNGSGIDFAIIKVSPAPRVSVGVDISRRPTLGRAITIFSHPNMEPLQWSKTCYLQSQSTGVDLGLSPQSLKHMCDTNPGSSGATILSANSLKIIGIHDGGILSAPKVGVNYGTYLSGTVVATELARLGFR